MLNNAGMKVWNQKKDLLSSLWVFMSLNYILCDALTNMESSVLKGLIDGNAGGIEMNQGFLLAAGISLEIPFLMVVLAKVLPGKANKIVNIITAILMAVYQAGSFFAGSAPSLHYIFFSVIEVLGCVLIACLAWKMPEPSPNTRISA